MKEKAVFTKPIHSISSRSLHSCATARPVCLLAFHSYVSMRLPVGRHITQLRANAHLNKGGHESEQMLTLPVKSFNIFVVKMCSEQWHSKMIINIIGSDN
jgi:hypothetical protein